MGHHTWFYRAATNDEYKIFKETLIFEIENIINRLNNAKVNGDSDLEVRYECQIKDLNDIICQSETWDERTKEDYLSILKYAGYTSIYNYINELKIKAEQSFEDWINEWLEEEKEKLKKLDKSINTLTPQEIDAMDQYTYLNGIIEKFDGKLYVESGYLFNDNKYRLDLHDVFRYNNNDDIKLRSYDETLEFCKTKNIDLDLEQMRDLKIWFDTYPDSFIEFS